MPKPASSNPNNEPSFDAPRYRPNWLAALISGLLGLWLTVAMFDYDPLQVGYFTQNTTNAVLRNFMGEFGTDCARMAFIWFGGMAWLLPCFCGRVFWIALRGTRRLTGARVAAMVLTLCAGCGLAAMVKLDSLNGSQWFPAGRLGGVMGKWIYDDMFADTLGLFGTATLLLSIYVVGLAFIFTKDITATLEKLLQHFHDWRDARVRNRAELAELRKQQADAPVKNGPGPDGLFPAIPATAAKAAAPTPAPVKAAPPPAPLVLKVEKAAPKPSAPAEPGKIELNIVKPEETKKSRATLTLSTDDNYQAPPLSLLKEQSRPATGNSEEEHRSNAENLLRILREFGVEVTLGEIHVGPVITRYEVVPAAGVRVEKIAGLDKNIALGMRAQSVRILAPIPGKAAVGVEVPNQHATPVGLREIIESEDWSAARAEIPIALGKDVSGKPLISDLAKMPHLLIAGATGSGKSVCINAIVASILYSKSPNDLRLIMVDPKVVELKIFNTLPHMLIPVVTEPKKVPAALKILLKEMENRYQIFAKCNVRNIVGFNSRKKAGKAPPPPDPQASLAGVDPLALDDGIEIPDRLPYIVAIIDELADLMMVAPAEIETCIARLAQLARAAGIHLIIATQRPSVNVITGVIKANLPSRIAFQVASQVDSRTILDGKGADTLIGRGDMLFSPPGSSRLVRAQGAFVADEEIMEIVEFLKRNGPPKYDQSVQQQIDRAAAEDNEEDGGGSGEEGDLGDEDKLFQQALDVLKSSKRASTSMLQRRLSIGYNRAARIMDLMEERGIVGPENGSSPREILKDLDSL